MLQVKANEHSRKYARHFLCSAGDLDVAAQLAVCSWRLLRSPPASSLAMLRNSLSNPLRQLHFDNVYYKWQVSCGT